MNTKANNPAPSDASLDPANNRFDAMEVELRNGFMEYSYEPLSQGSWTNQGASTRISAFGEMSPSDAERYNQYWNDVANGVDTDSRVKLSDWEYRPDAELYKQYQNVYDNPEYFDQSTGKVIYPGTNGFVNGSYNIDTIQPGKIIDRYGSNGNGQYFSPEGTSYEERALPPFMEQQPYTKYEVVKPLSVKAGETAPWFDQLGGGTQYLTDMTVDELKDLGYIVPID